MRELAVAGDSTEGGVMGRIGPNAVTRVAEALRDALGEAVTREVFDRAGLHAYLGAPPQRMVDQAEVRALHDALRGTLGGAHAARIAREAGVRTGDYLLAHRIPQMAQRLLRMLPARLACRLLLAAVSRHAWTFAGSGRFGVSPGRGRLLAVLSIQANPLCLGLSLAAPACAYHAATFERLFRVLVSPRVQVREVACEAAGGPCCRFEVRLPGR